jgi:hypothetical protein
MHHNRNGGATAPSMEHAAPLPPIDRVCGLGVCDVLRVEFECCQLPLLRAELEELRRVCDDSISGALQRDADDDFDRLRYERRLLDAIYAQLDIGRGSSARVVLHGPARLISEIVAGAAQEAVDRLAERVRRRQDGRTGATAALADAVRAAAAWVDTYVALEAVASYSFDPDFDHVRDA